MTVTKTLDRFQQRHPWAGFPIAVVYKFIDDQGTYLAAMMTYFGFLSLFPLLLLFVSILGYVLRSHEGLRHDLLDSALTQFPVVGADLAKVSGLHGSGFALVIGIVGSLYGGLGVITASQNAMNKVWAVPREQRPNAVRTRVISLLVLIVLGVGILLTTVLTALTTGAQAYGANIGAGVRVLSTVLAVGINAVLFVFAFRVLTARRTSLDQVLWGAIAAAIGWQLLQLVGSYYVGHKLKGASETYGPFGLVLGLLAWIYLGSLLVVLCAEANAVRANRMWPRNLMAPFDDDADLTAGDERAYASYPPTEKHKPNERVNVDFDDPA